LKIADSLYEQKKYTESFGLYHSILEAHHHYTPQMLLKMAFIKEGLREYSQALYYLNMYYLHTTDKKALAKMEELAKTHRLEGYEYSDFEFFMMIYRKYSNQITYGLLAICIFLFAYIIRQKIKLQVRPTLSGIALTFLLAVLFYHINFSDDYKKGIIIGDNAYLMESPSSGADLAAIVEDGHRVDVVSQKDVWVEIKWKGDKVFIRENNIATFQ